MKIKEKKILNNVELTTFKERINNTITNGTGRCLVNGCGCRQFDGLNGNNDPYCGCGHYINDHGGANDEIVPEREICTLRN